MKEPLVFNDLLPATLTTLLFCPGSSLCSTRPSKKPRFTAAPHNHELSAPWTESGFFSLLHSLRWASGSLVKPDDHRTLHCRCVLNFVSQSLQPAPVSAEIPRNASHLPDGLKKLQTSSRWDPLCYTVRQDQSQTSELQGNAAAAVDSHKQAASVSPNPLNLIITRFWTPASPGSCREPQSISPPTHTQSLLSGNTCFFCITKAEPSVNPVLQLRHSTRVYGAQHNHFCYLLCCF